MTLFLVERLSCYRLLLPSYDNSFCLTLQIEVIWEELGSKFKDLLGMGKSGVVASIIAACQRLQTNADKV